MNCARIVPITAIAILIALTATTHAAVVVNVDIDQTADNFSGQGALPTPGNVWTSTDAVSITNLPDSTGVATSIGFIRSGWAGFGSGSGATHNLMRDYVFSNSTAPGLLTLTGLTPGDHYLLYLYGARQHLGSGAGSTFFVDINNDGDTTDPGETIVLPATFAGGNFVLGDTYAVFDGVIATATGQIVVQVKGNAASPNVGIFNGFQITHVPAPAALPAGLAMLALAAVRRRR